MQVATSRFGLIEVKEEAVYQFPQGLPGFDRLRRFALLPVADNPVFAWLQSLEKAEVAFLLVDPFIFFPLYEVELKDSQLKELEIKEKEDVLVYSVVTIPPEGLRQATVNLLAPVVLSRPALQGCQVLLEQEAYQTRHLLFPKQPEQACG
jgi:flagellar assembly factor FliW